MYLTEKLILRKNRNYQDRTPGLQIYCRGQQLAGIAQGVISDACEKLH